MSHRSEISKAEMFCRYTKGLAVRAALGFVVAGAFALDLAAKGDLSIRCKKLPELVLGTDNTGYAVSQKEYKIETGKCYGLEIKSSGKKEYVLRGANFFRNMWVRKIEAGDLEIKATHLYELEYEDEPESEIFFTMIKPGTYKLSAIGLESKGTVITFIVE
ncbi:MAG: copper-binding protein [Methyloligellaceae bacterium]